MKKRVVNMKRKIVLTAVLALLLAVFSLVAAQSNPPGTGWTTGMQFQNVGDAPADVRLFLYTPQGQTVDCGSRVAQPGSSVNYLVDVDCTFAGEFGGSAVVESNQPMRGIVHVNNAGVGQAGGIYNATTMDEVSTTLLFPLVKHNHSGRTTTFHIQNASSEAVNITATFRVKGVPYTKQYNGVLPNTMVVVTPADAGVPAGNGQVGSLTVTGTGPLAGTSLEHQHTAAVAQNLQATQAFAPADYDDKVYCPLFRNAHTGLKLSTGAQVQNVGANAQTVTLTYTPRDGGPTVTKSETVQPGASATFYAPFLGIPAGSVGSVIISGQDDIVAVVNDEGTEGGVQRTTTYACFPASQATNKIVMPLYKEYWIGNTTGIQIQNVAENGEAASIEITYIATNKSSQVTLTPGVTVAAGGSTTFYGISNKISPPTMTVVSGNPAAMANTFGSVIIESNTPIVAIANESGFGVGSQDSKNYEGFNQ
jgi:hypothetical protein